MKNQLEQEKISPWILDLGLKYHLTFLYFIFTVLIIQANEHHSIYNGMNSSKGYNIIEGKTYDIAYRSSNLSIGVIDKPQFTVSGVVTDSNGVPLAGASIVEKGTTNG